MESQTEVKDKTLPGLTEGRIVHYVCKDGAHRPAIVVKAWRNLITSADGYVNLQVYTDGIDDVIRFNDDVATIESVKRGLVHLTSVIYSEEKFVNSWHWIEKA